MREPPGELAQKFHALGLDDLFVEPLRFRNINTYARESGQVAVLVLQGIGAHGDRLPLPVLGAEVDLQQACPTFDPVGVDFPEIDAGIGRKKVHKIHGLEFFLGKPGAVDHGPVGIDDLADGVEPDNERGRVLVERPIAVFGKGKLLCGDPAPGDVANDNEKARFARSLRHEQNGRLSDDLLSSVLLKGDFDYVGLPVALARSAEYLPDIGPGQARNIFQFLPDHVRIRLAGHF